MKITLDKSVDAAYIYFENSTARTWGIVKKTVTVNPQEVNGMINLDFDANGKLIGVEIMDASIKLPEELLNQAEIIG